MFNSMRWKWNTWSLILKVVTLIFSFPRIRKTASTDLNFKRKYGYWTLKIILNGFIYWIYSELLVIPFITIPQDFQWILGLLTPFPKMLFIKLYLKICSKAHGSVPRSVKVSVVHNLELQHALFLVLTMGFTANTTTTYTILGLQLLISLYNGLNIIYKLKYSKKGNSENEGRLLFLKHILRSNSKC